MESAMGFAFWLQKQGVLVYYAKSSTHPKQNAEKHVRLDRIQYGCETTMKTQQYSGLTSSVGPSVLSLVACFEDPLDLEAWTKSYMKTKRQPYVSFCSILTAQLCNFVLEKLQRKNPETFTFSFLPLFGIFGINWIKFIAS